MALVARVRESAADVVRVGGTRKIRAVAGVATRAQCGCRIHVTLPASDCRVSAGQGESCRSMVERRGRPTVYGVTSCAVRGESADDMIGECDSLKIVLVTAVAVGR